MTDAWDDMRRAKENEYLERKNHDALDRLGAKKQVSRVPSSPVSGEPMEQMVVNGVVVARCKTTGGIWIDHAELQQLKSAIAAGKTGQEAGTKDAEQLGWVAEFFYSLIGD